MDKISQLFKPSHPVAWRRLVLFLSLSLMGLIAVSVAVVVLALCIGEGETSKLMRVTTMLQDLLLFVMPPVACAVIVSRHPGRLLCIEGRLPWRLLWLCIAAQLCAIPLVNSMVEWNESLTLPASMSGIEAWMRSSEEAARQAIEQLMGGTTVGSLVVSLLIVGVMAGLSEELWFRGGLQRLLATGGMNRHLAVWLTAFIFSAIHLQFFGFFPRFFLGLLFGYMLVWTGSLWIPVICHVLNNSMVVAVTWAGARGSETAVALDKFGTEGASQSFWLTASLLLTCVMLYLIYANRRTKYPDVGISQNQHCA